MEAKEKAKELVDSYIDIMPPLAHQTWYTIMDFAKKCALVAVDEILNELQSYSDLKSYISINDEYLSVINVINYWNHVKSEINKL